MAEVPRPEYSRDVAKLQKAYESALKDVQKELRKAVNKPDAAFVKATEENIRSILSDINKYGEDWASHSISKASRDGVARTMVDLGYAKTYTEALRTATFSQTNRKLVDAAIADTQRDLLAMTTNMQRQSILAVRKVTSETFRTQLARGINHSDDLSREMQRRLERQANLAIIDSAGRRWKVGTYTHMLAQTKMMEAHKQAAMQSAIDEGRYYGRISRHGAVDACGQWEGKIVKYDADAPGDYPYYDSLPRREIFHPNCRHVISTIRTPDEIRNIVQQPTPSSQSDILNRHKRENRVAITEFDRVTDVPHTLSSDKQELRRYMTALLNNSEIDAKVSIRKIDGAYGQVAYTMSGVNNRIKATTFSLHSDHLNHIGMPNSLYHEFYHVRYDGLTRGKLSRDLFIEYEETATELAANYMRIRKGYDGREVLANPQFLTRNLPILKQMDEFKGLENIQDFGENFMKYRFDPQHNTADWDFLASKMEPIKNKFNYDNYFAENYNDYIRKNINEMSLDLSMFYGDGTAKQYKDIVLNHLDGVKLTKLAYDDVIMMAMMRIGVK